ncbi:MAG: response regulator transcription factor [Deltaproteobacteria bacterium]|nr:response regulator transcription factor [Deltaproteobacteria bacterium]
MKVLIAEDDPNIRAGLLEVLSSEGYFVHAAEDGEQALAAFRAQSFDFVCLDVMMPKRSGYEVLREIRRGNTAVPVVFLSAKTEEIDRVLGLELGADDYILKPFGKNELIARFRAISRRTYAAIPERPEDASFEIGDLEVRPRELRARRGPKDIELSLREVRLLRELANHPNEVLDREHLYRTCWDGAYPNSRTLDQHVSKLRKKIERDPSAPDIVLTVHGVGYRYPGHTRRD